MTDEKDLKIKEYEQALATAREAGNKAEELANLDNLGEAYYSLDDFQRTIEFHHKAAEIAHQIGDKPAEADNLHKMSRASWRLFVKRRKCNI